MTVAPGCSRQLADRDQRGDRDWARPARRARRRRSSGRRRRRRPARCRRRPRRTCACRSTQVLRLERVGLVVGERAVELEVQRDDVAAAARRSTVGHGVAAHAVAGVDDDRAAAGCRDRSTSPRRYAGVVGEQVALSVIVPRRGRRTAGQRPCSASSRISAQPGVLADRRGAGAAQLDAVVLRRVVAGGEHRAGQVERAAGEVEHVGRAEADVDDVGALRGRTPSANARDQLGRGRRACRGR